MKLFETIKKSIYSPEFYGSLQSQPVSFSIRYYYSLVVALGLALSILVAIALVPLAKTFLKSAAYSLVRVVPDDLVVTVHKGQVTVNKDEPMFIALPADLKFALSDTNAAGVENLFVIDTKSSIDVATFNRYKTLLLVTKDSVIAADDQKGLRVVSLENSPDRIITKATVASFADRAKSFIKWIAPLVLFGVFFGSLLGASALLLYFLFGALLVWLVARIRHANLSYGKSYQVALHASTLGILLYVLSIFLFFPHFPSFLLLVTVSLAAVSWANLRPKETAPTDADTGKKA